VKTSRESSRRFGFFHVSVRLLVELSLALFRAEVDILSPVLSLCGCLFGLDIHPAHGVFLGSHVSSFLFQGRTARPGELTTVNTLFAHSKFTYERNTHSVQSACRQLVSFSPGQPKSKTPNEPRATNPDADDC
jgi:hypothetical protein